MIAGRAEDIPGRGDYITFDDLGVPIVIVRGADGEIRAFYNTCQHRGAPVVRDASRHRRTLRCQYHSWTYDITDGTLIHVPDERDFVGLCRGRARPACELRCEVWDGWIFVNQDPDAAPLHDWFGPVARSADEFQGDRLRDDRRAKRGRAVQLEGHRRGVPRGVPLPPHPRPRAAARHCSTTGAPRWACCPTGAAG